MTEEFGEVIKAIHKNNPLEEIQGELGDLLAWIFCIANILGIQISKSIEETFTKEISRQLKVYNRLKYTDALGNLFFLSSDSNIK